MSFPGKFYCIADTHLYPGCRQRGDVLRFLWGVDAPVYWLGDSLEGYREDGNLHAMYAGDEIDREIAVYFETAMLEGRVIPGNHDNELPLIKDHPEAIRGNGTALTHGHKWDVWFCTPGVERSSDWFGKLAFLFESIGIKGAAQLVRGFRDGGWVARAEEWMKSRAITMLVMGHTHEPEIWITNSGAIAVCGAWKEGAPYSVVKVENGVPSLIEWTTWANEADKPLPPEEAR